MKKIKWENIVTMIMIVLSVWSIVVHVQLNGFYFELFQEVGLYVGMTFVARYIVKDMRKN